MGKGKHTDASPHPKDEDAVSLKLYGHGVERDVMKVAPRLTELKLRDVEQKDLSFLQSCPKLQKLDLARCRGIGPLPSLPELTELKINFSNLPAIGSMPKLKTLEVTYSALSSIGEMP